MDLLNDTEQTAMALRAIITEIPKMFEFNSQGINICEKETQDLLHLIELTSFDACKGYKLSKDIQDVRIRRRELKDQNEVLEPLVELTRRMKTFENEINKCIGEIRRIKKRHEMRSYKMRVREDLQEILEEANQ